MIVVGSLAIWLSSEIVTSRIANEADPGSRAFPVALSLVLIAGGLAEGSAAVRGTRPGIETDHRFAGGRLNFVLMLFTLCVYVWLLSILGFASATLLFAFAWMWRLGSRPVSSLILSAILVLVIEVLFREVFHVQLPVGSYHPSIDAVFFDH